MHRCVVLLLVSLASLSVGQQANLWPLPQQVATGSGETTLQPNSFTFTCAGSSCSNVLKSAFERYKGMIFFAGSGEHREAATVLPSVRVSASSAPPLAFGVDESYKLSVSATSADITAATEWGALRALETFSQLVQWNSTTGGYSITTVPVVVVDAPRFGWRGLLVDSSRHFLPVATVKRAIDAMSYNKMNVLHWHIVDSQSFPVESKVYPLLTKGAWSPKAVYTQAQIQDVVQYAMLRGVRVMPEFDTPGHAYPSWAQGYPNLFPNCPGHSPVFDVTQNYTYTFMKNFLSEMATLFTDSFMHLGGDEVSYGCWQNVPAIVQWMKDNGVENYSDLQGYYEKQLETIVTNHLSKSPVYWDEVFGEDEYPLEKTAVVNVWNEPVTEVIKVVQAGYRAVYSSPWYLDRQVPDPTTFYLWEDTWIDFYAADPIGDASLTPEQTARVLGGEASMWGEQVDDTCFDIRVWPRAAAVAERLWSGKDVTSYQTATPRLGTQRCRMVRRGINAGPIYPDYCELP